MLAITRDPTPHKAFIDYIMIAIILHAVIMTVFAETVLQIIFDAGFIGAAGILPLLLSVGSRELSAILLNQSRKEQSIWLRPNFRNFNELDIGKGWVCAYNCPNSLNGNPGMKKSTALGVVLTLLLLGTQVVLAEGYPWKKHASPYDFEFENHIDTHQHSKGANSTDDHRGSASTNPIRVATRIDVQA